jgi:Ca2+-binding RTX toxin-like protein
LVGGDGDDVQKGGAGTDYLYGQDGNDILIGGAAGRAGANQLWGGAGIDTGSYSGTTGTVYADIGALAGYVDGELVDQMNSIENLTGGSGSNTLVGDGGSNVLTGGTGPDYLYGQGGDDTLIGGAAPAGLANQLWGGTGIDTASYVGATGSVYADLGALAGYVDGVLVDQMNSIENLTGGSGADTLISDSGANVLAGMGGADTLWGKGGANTFVYTAYDDSNLVTGYDTIADFVSGTSTLDLTALDTSAVHILIQSNAQSTSLYVEANPNAFNASTDLAISFVGANAIGIGDIRF